ERHCPWRGGPMQQKHHFALLGGRALPSSKDHLPHVEDGIGLQMVLRVGGLNTRVTHKIVGGDEGSNHAGKCGRPGREKHAEHDPSPGVTAPPQVLSGGYSNTLAPLVACGRFRRESRTLPHGSWPAALPPGVSEPLAPESG